MARLLAIEWDDREARAVAARASGRSLVVDEAFSIELEQTSAAYVAERLSQELSRRGVGRGDTLATVRRGAVELRELELPAAPDSELPAMVRMQALQQLPSMAENWALDFTPLPIKGEGKPVLAAALKPESLQQMQIACNACGGPAKSLVLRGHAAASLWRRKKSSSGKAELLIDMLAEEAMLIVMLNGQAVLLRNVRLSEHAPETALVKEVRLTQLAAQKQLGGAAIERVVLCGGDRLHRELQQKLVSEASLDAELFDPFEDLELSGSLENNVPENHGRYAALLGALWDETQSSHSLDFVNPRQPPPPPNRRVFYLAAAAALLLLMFVGMYWVQSELSRYDQKIQEAQAELKSMEPRLEKGEETRKELAPLDRFVEGDVNWMDQLHHLSENMPPGEKARVYSFSASASERRGGGTMLMDVAVDASPTITMLESQVRDSKRQVHGSGGKENPNRKELPWDSREEVTILPPSQVEANTAAEKPENGN